MFNLGFTGLLNAYITPVNVPELRSITNSNAPVYKLTPAFIHLSSLLNLPIGSRRHTINMEINSFISPIVKNASNTYITIQVNGPIIQNLFFILSTSASIITPNNYIGLFMSGAIDYYFDKYNLKTGIKTKWFSGGSNRFLPFSFSSASKPLIIAHTDL